MSGIDDPGTPPEVPEEYAAVYRDAYLRALEPESEPDRDDAPGRLTPLLIVAVVLVVLVVVVGVVAVLQMSGDDGAPNRAPGADPDRVVVTDSPAGPRPSAGPTTAPANDGAVEPVEIDEVTASCTSDPGVDSAGKRVLYDAGRVIDEDPSTAWRCDGRAVGETLTLELDEDTEVAGVGLIPGYAKTDPRSGDDRYAENNRITRVRWTLGNGVVIEQDLDGSPENRALQTIRVPRTATGSITLEILDVVEGSRNTTAISEVVVSEAR